MASYKYSVYNSQKRNSGRRGQSGGGAGKRRGEYINPERFVAIAKPTQAADYTAKHRFADFDIDDLLKRNLAAKGFEVPSLTM